MFAQHLVTIAFLSLLGLVQQCSAVGFLPSYKGTGARPAAPEEASLSMRQLFYEYAEPLTKGLNLVNSLQDALHCSVQATQGQHCKLIDKSWWFKSYQFTPQMLSRGNVPLDLYEYSLKNPVFSRHPAFTSDDPAVKQYWKDRFTDAIIADRNRQRVLSFFSTALDPTPTTTTSIPGARLSSIISSFLSKQSSALAPRQNRDVYEILSSLTSSGGRTRTTSRTGTLTSEPTSTDTETASETPPVPTETGLAPLNFSQFASDFLSANPFLIETPSTTTAPCGTRSLDLRPAQRTATYDGIYEGDPEWTLVYIDEGEARRLTSEAKCTGTGDANKLVSEGWNLVGCMVLWAIIRLALM